MYDVTFTRESGRRVAVVCYQARPEEIGAKAGEAFGRVAEHLARTGTPVTGPAVSCYTTGPETFDVASGFVVDGEVQPGDGVEQCQLPSCDIATTTHVGPYDELAKAYDALRAGVLAHGRRLVEDGIMWEEYWSPPGTPPEQTRTVVCWPVVPQDD